MEEDAFDFQEESSPVATVPLALSHTRQRSATLSKGSLLKAGSLTRRASFILSNSFVGSFFKLNLAKNKYGTDINDYEILETIGIAFSF
jgi:hypothetical protein